MYDYLVSVVIPTFRGAKTLKRAIDSVREQTYFHNEIIVVDDNYPDSMEQKATEKIIESYDDVYNLHYITQMKKSNGSVARNVGVKAASGKYIFLLDDDDYYYPERIEKCVIALEQSGREVAFTDVEYYYNNKCYEKRKVRLSADSFLYILMNDNAIGTGSNIVIRRDAFFRVGGFDENLKRLQDYEFLLNVFMNGYHPLVINEVLVRKYRCDRNIPLYKEYKEIFDYIMNKYKSVIDKYSVDDRNNIDFHIHKVLYRMAIYNKDINGIKYEKLFVKESMGIKENIREMFVYLPATQLIRRIYYMFKPLKVDNK